MTEEKGKYYNLKKAPDLPTVLDFIYTVIQIKHYPILCPFFSIIQYILVECTILVSI